MEFNFADDYAVDGQTLGADILKARSPVFAKLRQELSDPVKVVDLIKYYYELDSGECPDWIFNKFFQSDETFSRVRNKIECRVIAKCLLKAAMADKSMTALLGIQTAFFSTNKETDQVDTQFPRISENELLELGLKARKDLFFTIQPPDVAVTNKATIISLAVGGDSTKLGEALKAIVQDSINLQKSLASKVNTVTSKIASLQQENEMLWWYVGAWSRLLHKPFEDLEPSQCALMIGTDLASLTKNVPGPASIKPLIHKMLVAAKVDFNFEISIKELVNNNGEELADLLVPNSECITLPLCPIISGFSRYKEIGEPNIWVNSYKKTFGFDPEIKLKPIEIGFQIYQEQLLINHIG
jgi:hypothetical protein